ncbi:MAG TPA: hypothetical protein VLH84_00265 [Patescibacteria group bacterium]|nr:hypothetical protein [Patescibacteria group bacterium]
MTGVTEPGPPQPDLYDELFELHASIGQLVVPDCSKELRCAGGPYRFDAEPVVALFGLQHMFMDRPGALAQFADDLARPRVAVSRNSLTLSVRLFSLKFRPAQLRVLTRYESGVDENDLKFTNLSIYAVPPGEDSYAPELFSTTKHINVFTPPQLDARTPFAVAALGQVNQVLGKHARLAERRRLRAASQISAA